MPAYPCLSAPGRQRGSGAVEFALAAIPILLAGLGAVELSRWFFVKQAISLALLEAGRAGITDHARPASIEAAFERALLPLFPSTSTRSAQQRLQQAFEQRRAATGEPPWRIRVTAPAAAAFLDFASPGLTVPGAGGGAVIDNTYQAEQHARYQQQGWPGGRGPFSGVTIFEANELALDLIYMHEPLVPGMAALLRLLSAGSAGYASRALAGGYLPLRQTLRLAMQSHPVAWPHSGPRVVGAADPAHEAAPAAGPAGPCHGLWCQHARPAPSSPAQPVAPVEGSSPPAEGSLPPSVGRSPPAEDPSAASPPPPASAPPGTSPAAPPPAEGPALPGADDIACGTVVCCLEG